MARLLLKFSGPSFQALAVTAYLAGAMLLLTALQTTRGIAHRSLDRHERPGDVRIALVAPIFSKGPGDNTDGCTFYNYRRSGVLLIVEAFMYVLRDRYKFILGNGTHNATVGFFVGDSCSSPLEAAGVTVDVSFRSNSHLAATLKNSISKACGVDPTRNASSAGQNTQHNPKDIFTRLADKVIAVVGPTRSSLVLDFSPLLSAFHIPHVAPGANAASGQVFCSPLDTKRALSTVEKSSLDDCKFQHEYFSRTVPSDIYLIKALVDTMEKMNWRHIVLLADSSRQGRSLFAAFQRMVFLRGLAAEYNDKKICISFSALIPLENEDRALQLSALDFVLNGLKESRARVVVLLSEVEPAHLLFRYIIDKKEKIRRVWLGTEWGQDPDIFSARAIVDATLERFVAIFPMVPLPFWNGIREKVDNFTDHMNRKTVMEVREDKGNPWLCLDWEIFLNCLNACNSRYQSITIQHRLDICGPSNKTCSLLASLSNCSPIPRHALLFTSVPHVIFATELLLKALSDVWQNVSSTGALSGDQMKSKFLEAARGATLQRFIQNVKMPCGESQEAANTTQCSVFPSESDIVDKAPPSYSIVTTEPKHISPGFTVYNLVEAGIWIKNSTTDQGNIRIDLQKLERIWGRLPLSDCRPKCKVGEVGLTAEDKCCWKCTPCSGENITNLFERRCEPCPQRKIANVPHTACVDLPVRTAPGYYTGLIITASLILLTDVCVLITLFALVYKRKSLAVKSADSHLSAVMLIGIFFGMLSLIALHLPANSRICVLARLFIIPWLLLTATATLVKTSRIARLWLHANMGRLAIDIWTLSTRAQLIFITVILLIGIAMEATLASTYGGGTEQFYASEFSYHICKQHLYHLATDIYTEALLIVTCIWAFLIRKMPSVSNESHRLFLASFCVCTTWLLLTPLAYLSTNYRSTVLSLRVTGQMLSIWCWLFLPRLYILKKSNRHLLKSSRNSGSQIRTIQGGNTDNYSYTSEALGTRSRVSSST